MCSCLIWPTCKSNTHTHTHSSQCIEMLPFPIAPIKCKAFQWIRYSVALVWLKTTTFQLSIKILQRLPLSFIKSRWALYLFTSIPYPEWSILWFADKMVEISFEPIQNGKCGTLLPSAIHIANTSQTHPAEWRSIFFSSGCFAHKYDGKKKTYAQIVSAKYFALFVIYLLKFIWCLDKIFGNRCCSECVGHDIFLSLRKLRSIQIQKKLIKTICCVWQPNHQQVNEQCTLVQSLYRFALSRERMFGWLSHTHWNVRILFMLASRLFRLFYVRHYYYHCSSSFIYATFACKHLSVAHKQQQQQQNICIYLPKIFFTNIYITMRAQRHMWCEQIWRLQRRYKTKKKKRRQQQKTHPSNEATEWNGWLWNERQTHRCLRCEVNFYCSFERHSNAIVNSHQHSNLLVDAIFWLWLWLKLFASYLCACFMDKHLNLIKRNKSQQKPANASICIKFSQKKKKKKKCRLGDNALTENSLQFLFRHLLWTSNRIWIVNIHYSPKAIVRCGNVFPNQQINW